MADARSASFIPPLAYSVLAHLAIYIGILSCGYYQVSQTRQLDMINMISFEPMQKEAALEPQKISSATKEIVPAGEIKPEVPPPVVTTVIPEVSTKPKALRKTAQADIPGKLMQISKAPQPNTQLSQSSDLTSAANASELSATTGKAQDGSQFGNSMTGGSYDSLVMSQLIAAKRYPERARRRGLQGDVVLAFSVNRDGSVSNQQLSKPSDSEILNDEALAMISRAAPFPPPPENYLPGKTINYRVPVKFTLY